MSKSRDFCISRASNPLYSGFVDRDFSKCKEIDSSMLFDKYLNGERKWNTADFCNNVPKVQCELIINPEADFSYFSSICILSDGSLDNWHYCLNELVVKIITTNTFDKNVGYPFNGGKIKYTVGNFVYLTEFDEAGNLFTPKEKPFLRERITALLPIKYEMRED